MKIASNVFKHNELIPSKYPCDGENINPPLKFFDVSENAQNLVLIMDDPDASQGTWVHWTVWNIDPETKEIKENNVPSEAIEGITGFGRSGYGGPCPPSGIHRYFFKLYALDTKFDLTPDTDKSGLEKAMESHILAKAELIGLYSRR